MTLGSCRSKECGEDPAQQGETLHLCALRSVGSSVAGFAALSVGEKETPNPFGLVPRTFALVERRMPISEFLISLRIIATSTNALIGYVCLVAAWAYIAARTMRNKQLLEKLSHIPEVDRLEALRIEMGAARLKAGLNPEQYLRSKIHFYYLIAFLSALLTVVLLAAIAWFEPVTKKAGYENVTVGATKEFIISSIGPAQYAKGSDSQRVQYIFEDYYLFIVYQDNKVAAFGLTSRKENFKPCILDICLGLDSFADVGGSPDWFNRSSKEYTYVERLAGDTTASRGVSKYVFLSDFGHAFGECALNVDSIGEAEQLVRKNDTTYLRAREECRPNGVGLASYSLEDGVAFIVWPENSDTIY